jgi:hypothetical protein
MVWFFQQAKRMRICSVENVAMLAKLAHMLIRTVMGEDQQESQTGVDRGSA